MRDRQIRKMPRERRSDREVVVCLYIWDRKREGFSELLEELNRSSRVIVIEDAHAENVASSVPVNCHNVGVLVQ